MNDERRPAGGAREHVALKVAPDPSESNVLASVVQAREAIEDGDRDFALAILANVEAELRPTQLRPHACPYCPLAFEWPGLRDAHLDRTHPSELADAA